MDDFLAVQVGETVENAFGDFTEDFLACAASEFFHFAVDGVERAAFAELHGDGDCGCRGVDKGAVVETDVFGGAVFVEVEFADDLALYVWIRGCRDYLWM